MTDPSAPLEADTPIRVGVAGLGYWGPNLARNFAAIEGCELVWCCDGAAAARSRAAAQFPGVRITGEDRRPVCDPRSLESNVPGLYLAGVIVAGDSTHEIFIENGRFHGRQIADDLKVKLLSSAPQLARV